LGAIERCQVVHHGHCCRRHNIVAPSGTPEVRIRCGYSKGSYYDYRGNLWLGDRYFSGGYPTQLSNQYIAGTRDQHFYLTMRSGTFSYSIPAPPGTYELHLHFSETTYSLASTLGGGENSRVFNVRLNGEPLLDEFDIVSDAGSDTADVRVFRDVHPDATGHVRLDFSGLISQLR
jgi:Malectin domain